MYRQKYSNKKEETKINPVKLQTPIGVYYEEKNKSQIYAGHIKQEEEKGRLELVTIMLNKTKRGRF